MTCQSISCATTSDLHRRKIGEDVHCVVPYVNMLLQLDALATAWLADQQIGAQTRQIQSLDDRLLVGGWSVQGSHQRCLHTKSHENYAKVCRQRSPDKEFCDGPVYTLLRMYWAGVQNL